MNDSTANRNNSPARWLIIGGCFALLVAITWQWRSISEMRRENGRLRTQIDSAPKDVAIQATARGMEPDNSDERLQKDQTELLRLRNKVRQLQETVATAATDARRVPSRSAATARRDELAHLGAEAMQGNYEALEQLARIAAGSGMSVDEKDALRADFRQTFAAFGAEAGRGNAKALQTLWQASRLPDLEGFAVDALGQAAGLGNAEALKPLLDPEDYFISRSSAVGALKPAADAGNVQAIEALAATAADPKQHALWYVTADGLASAASAGSAIAIDSLAVLAADNDPNIKRAAVMALEIAAAKGQPSAQQALQKLTQG